MAKIVVEIEKPAKNCLFMFDGKKFINISKAQLLKEVNDAIAELKEDIVLINGSLEEVDRRLDVLEGND